MRLTRTPLVAALLMLATAAGLTAASAAPARAHRPAHSALRQPSPAAALAADEQLLTALRAQMAAARQLEAATLAAVETRLRDIYATPSESPLVALMTGDAAGAQALAELSAAMESQDAALLGDYTNAVANLRAAKADLASNVLRIGAQIRIIAAQRAARTVRHHAAAPGPVIVVYSTSSHGSAGLPAAVLANHELPGVAPTAPTAGSAR